MTSNKRLSNDQSNRMFFQNQLKCVTSKPFQDFIEIMSLKCRTSCSDNWGYKTGRDEIPMQWGTMTNHGGKLHPFTCNFINGWFKIICVTSYDGSGGEENTTASRMPIVLATVSKELHVLKTLSLLLICESVLNWIIKNRHIPLIQTCDVSSVSHFRPEQANAWTQLFLIYNGENSQHPRKPWHYFHHVLES